jgi:hypothetical protein
LLDKPDEWLAAKQTDMVRTHRVGDALPHVRVDYGPVLLASFFGGEREFGSDTAWTHAFIDDEWSNEPHWNVSEDNPWWRSMDRLFELAAADAVGRYVVCAPDVGGSADVLLNLRGATDLCMDVIDRPERVGSAIDAMYGAWERTFTAMYDTVVGKHGAGLIHWFGLWSNVPYHAPACDFNYMIGPKEFEQLCLPDIARQSAAAGRACFHLDGPMAARHIDAILEVPDIQAIQFTPGVSAPSALAWVEMFRKVQAADRAVLVYCPAEEVLELCDMLQPEGLAILLDNPPPVTELDTLYAAFCTRYGITEKGTL